MLSRRVAAAPAQVWDAVASGAGRPLALVGCTTRASRRARRRRVRDLRAAGHDVKGEVREACEGRAISYEWDFFPCMGGVKLPAPTLITFLLRPTERARASHSSTRASARARSGTRSTTRTRAAGAFFMSNLATTLDDGIDQRAGRSIERALTISASPERVWKALVEPKDLERWQCKRAACDAREGGAFRWSGRAATADGFEGGRVGEGRVACVRGREGASSSSTACSQFTEGKHSTMIAFDLAPEADGAACRLTLVHSGFDADPAWDGYYRGHREAWGSRPRRAAIPLRARRRRGRVLRCEVAFDGRAGGPRSRRCAWRFQRSRERARATRPRSSRARRPTARASARIASGEETRISRDRGARARGGR